MNPLQEKLNETVIVFVRKYGEIDKETLGELTALVNLTLEEAKQIVAESGEDYYEAYEALDKMKIIK